MLTRMYPELPETCELTVTCPPGQYAASVVARAVEDCDAHLLNLNVTAEPGADGRTVVELRISHRDGHAVARSLARYGYDVTDIRGAAPDPVELAARERINALLHELNI